MELNVFSLYFLDYSCSLPEQLFSDEICSKCMYIAISFCCAQSCNASWTSLYFELSITRVSKAKGVFVPKAVFQVSELISQKLGIFNSSFLLFNQQRTQGKKLITAVKRKMYSLTLLHLGTSVFPVQQWGSGKTTLQLEISTVNRICTSSINLQAIGKIK